MISSIETHERLTATPPAESIGVFPQSTAQMLSFLTQLSQAQVERLSGYEVIR